MSKQEKPTQTGQPIAGEPLFVTIAEVARALRYTESGIIKMMRRGKLPGQKVGSEWRMHIDDFRALTARRSATDPHEPAAAAETPAAYGVDPHTFPPVFPFSDHTHTPGSADGGAPRAVGVPPRGAPEASSDRQTHGRAGDATASHRAAQRSLGGTIVVTWGNKYGVKLAGDKAITWYSTESEARQVEFKRLWGDKMQQARQSGKTIILPAAVARQAKAAEEGK